MINHSARQRKVVNPITKLPTEELITHNLHDRPDIINGKSFLRCSIQEWGRFTKVYDEQLSANVLYFVAMLIAEVLEEVGTSNGLLCHSDNDDFTILDLATVIPRLDEHLQQRFTPEALTQEPVYIDRIRKLVNGDKIPTSLKLITKLITADEFFQMKRHQRNEAS